MWYQPMNFNFEDENKYCEAICKTNMAREALAKVESDELREAIKAEIREEFVKRMGKGVLDPKSFEVMIISAVKA